MSQITITRQELLELIVVQVGPRQGQLVHQGDVFWILGGLLEPIPKELQRVRRSSLRHGETPPIEDRILDGEPGLGERRDVRKRRMSRGAIRAQQPDLLGLVEL